MKVYETLPAGIQLLLEEAVSSDPYGLSPKTLYKNISASLQSCSTDRVAEIYDVSLSLTIMIKEFNETTS